MKVLLNTFGGDTVAASPFASEYGIADAARVFNNPPIVICEANYAGCYPAQAGFASLVAKSVSVSTVKKACDGSFEVIRLYEYCGVGQTVVLSFFGVRSELKFDPYEIKTLRVTENGFEEISIIED